jgi:hypothetical protein
VARWRPTGTVAGVGRSSARCPSCGEVMPAAAAYCPACGAASGNLRVEAVGGEVEAPSADVALGGHRRRWLAPVVIAAVSALIVVVAVAGGGRDEPSASPATVIPATTPAPSTTVVPRSTVPAPSTTTTGYSAFSAAPMPEAAGVVLYETTNEGAVLRIDLGTGAVQRRYVPVEPRVAGPWMVLARQGGFAMADGSYDDQSPLYGVADGPDTPAVTLAAWSEHETHGTLAPRVAAAAEPDQVWVWNDAMDGEQVTIKRMRLDGTPTAGPVTLPRFASVLGQDGPGALALQGASGFYRATIEGQELRIDRQWPTVPLAYSAGALLDLACDSALECQLTVVDRATGAARPVPGDVIDQIMRSYDNALSADGRWLATVPYGTSAGPKLTVYDLTTGAVALEDDVLPKNYGFLGGVQSAEFTTDGQWLVYFNISSGIRLWKVGSAGPPATFTVSGVTNVNMISVAPG